MKVPADPNSPPTGPALAALEAQTFGPEFPVRMKALFESPSGHLFRAMWGVDDLDSFKTLFYGTPSSRLAEITDGLPMGRVKAAPPARVLLSGGTPE